MTTADDLSTTARARRLLHARHLAAYRWATPFVAGRRVLEIGINVGYGVEAVSATARSVVGLDLSPDHARATRQRTGAMVVQADGQRLPFRDGSFDVVVSFQVIEHVWDVVAFLSELRRVVHPGGVVLLSTPQRKLRLHARQIPWNDEHLREYDEREWSETLAAAFGPDCEVSGLHGDEEAAGLERWRVARVAPDRWAHYLGGPWLRPLRGVARRLAPRSAAPAAAAAAQDDGDDALVRQFFVDPGRIESALDLLAICPVTSGAPPARTSFDATRYWRDRLGARFDLTGTGTSGLPAAWQRWLYRGKLRTIRRLLARNRVQIAGATVLDLGCGTGFFEDAWERLGARRTMGVDVVPEAIEHLKRAHPERTYLCADLATAADALQTLERPDLATAIDVLYHIVDDRRLVLTIRALARAVPPGGWLLFTDSLIESQPSAHVRFRSLNQWRQLLAAEGFEVVDREPTFAVNNVPLRGVTRAPFLFGAVQHAADVVVLRTMPWLANNWTVLARRSGA